MRPVVFLLVAGSLCARDRIATIDFYGYKGLDVDAVARALPFHVGDPFTPAVESRAQETVLRVIGRPATGVGAVCCDPNGDQHIYIGLPGESSRPFAYNPAPQGSMRLSRELVDLQKRIDAADDAAVRAGDAGEDDSQGYALSSNPASRALELKLRDYALQHEKELYAVLESSSNAVHRAYAASALGYASQSAEQIAALVRASRDPSEGVRNDATRALSCLAEKPGMAKLIPPDTFIGMMSSGIWSDRNKASFVLLSLTANSDPQLLARLRAQALDGIVEMARWHDMGHAFPGIAIFARIAGVPQDSAIQAAAGPVQAMLALLPPAVP
jgi:hypothetical protein